MDIDDDDVLLGAERIAAFLKDLGWPEDTDEDDVYYLKRTGRWPIGSTGPPGGGGKLIAIKGNIRRQVRNLAASKS